MTALVARNEHDAVLAVVAVTAGSSGAASTVEEGARVDLVSAVAARTGLVSAGAARTGLVSAVAARMGLVAGGGHKAADAPRTDSAVAAAVAAAFHTKIVAVRRGSASAYRQSSGRSR